MPLWVYYLPVFLIAISIFLGLGIIRYNLLGISSDGQIGCPGTDL